jgi:hypothetical protein
MFGTFNYSNIEAMDKIDVDGLHLDYYPLFFDQDTSIRIISALNGYEYPPTFFREADKKLKLCTKGAAWYVDYSVHKSAKDWSYTVCNDHVNGLQARELTGILKQLRDLITSFTGKEYNSVLVRKFNHGQDFTTWNSNQDPWLGEDYDTPCLSFGAVRKLEFRKKLDCVPPRIHKKDTNAQKETKKKEKEKNQRMTLQDFSLESGSLIITKNPTQKMWEHRIAYDDDICLESYHLIFRNVKPNLIHKQWQKYNRIIDLRPQNQLEKQWKTNQRMECKIEENLDQIMHEKTETGQIEKLSEKEANKAAKGFFEGIMESASNLFVDKVEKPPKVLRDPGKPIVSLEEQISSTTFKPIKTMKPEELEKKIKKETGRDVYIPYKGRKTSSKKKSKTVVVDLTSVPDAPVIPEKVTKKDKKNAIKRIYNQLLPIKDISPEYFNKKMKQISKRIKNAVDKKEIIDMETKILKNIERYKNQAIRKIKDSGLISESEFLSWTQS